MKVRTCLLFACMIVVPGLAMFSHRVPAEFRSATRCALWDPLLAWASSWTHSEDAGELETAGPGSIAETALTAAPGPAGAWSGGASTGFDSNRDHPSRQTPARPSGSGTRNGLAEPVAGDRLAGLGGTAVECRPLDGPAGTHVASCRVAMDAGGQLHRVFQAAGQTPDEAVAALADQVQQWRARLAVRAPADGAAVY